MRRRETRETDRQIDRQTETEREGEKKRQGRGMVGGRGRRGAICIWPEHMKESNLKSKMKSQVWWQISVLQSSPSV